MKSVNISEVIRIVSNISLLAPLAMYLLRAKFASKPIHIIGTIVIISGLSDIAGLILLNRQQSTVILFNAYYSILFFLLTWFYYEILFRNARKTMLWTGLGAYVFAFFAVTFFAQSVFEYQTLMWLITAVIMIMYSIAYFFFSLTNLPANGYFDYSFIWINIGIMIYFCLSLFLFTMGNYVLTKLDPATSALIWSTHNINNIVKNIVFAVGIYHYNRKVAYV